MEKNYFNNTNNQNKKEEIKTKIEDMRSVIYDEYRCKEIAQKLCAYIAKES